MSFNLLDLVKDQVAGQLADKAAGFLGEEQSSVTKALGGIFPSILGSVINKGASEEGASGLLDMIKGVDPGMLGNIGGLFGGDGPTQLLNSGGGLLSSLLGNKLGGAVDLISKISGLKSGSTMNLFKMAAPLLMGLIGKKVKSDNLGVSGLMSLLSNQKDHVSKALPSGMGALMGLSGLLGGAKDAVTGAAASVGAAAKSTVSAATNSAEKAASTVSSTVKDATSKGSNPKGDGGNNLFKWLIPALLVLAALFLLPKMCKNDNALTKGAESIKDGVSTVADVAKDGANAAADIAKDGANAVVDGAKSVGKGISKAFSKVNQEAKAILDKITFTAGSAGDQMSNYIKNGEGEAIFRFKNLKFNTGSAALDAKSVQEIDDIAAILKAYEGVNVEVQGYTDNTGDAAKNVALSKARAEAVKAALGVRGIDASRVSAQGFGSANPLTTNDTPEGRAENRRIEVKVVN